MQRVVSIGWLVGIVALGCGGDGGSSGESSTTGTTTTTDPGTTFVALDSSSGEVGLDSTTGGPPPGPGGECVLEDNDCTAEGQKCMPWSLEDDRIPDESRCCPLLDNPDLDGEPCQIMDYDGSCLDTCEANAMCVMDNPDSLTGVCRRFCDPMNPECDNDRTCKSFFELVPNTLTVPLCMDKCDPVVQDCSQNGWHCIPDTPTPSGQSGFICVSPPPNDPAGFLEPCALANDCEVGLVCVTANRVPDCDSISCCTGYCSLSDGDGPCTSLDPELVCVDWMSPDPEWSDVGVCALPG